MTVEEPKTILLSEHEARMNERFKHIDELHDIISKLQEEVRRQKLKIWAPEGKK